MSNADIVVASPTIATAATPNPQTIVDMSQARFRIVFECANAIRTLTDVMSSMLETVEIHVLKTPEFTGVKIEAMDPKQISLVVSQLNADVTMDCEHTAFCVNTKIFHTCIRSAQQHYAISIESMEGSSSVRIVSYEMLSNASVTRFTLPTLVCDQEQVQWNDLAYEINIDMETGELKGIVGMALKLQGDTLTLKLRQPLAAASFASFTNVDTKRQRRERKHMVLTISSTGACTQEHTFYSCVEERGDSCVAGKADPITNPPADEDLETTYEEVFAARHLADFLRSIDKNTVTLRLKKENPLILHHKFGSGEDSYVCLVVAPQVAVE